MKVTETQKAATSLAIKKIAYYTAKEAKGQRKQDAIEHCKQLGVDPTAKTFADAIAA